MIDFLIFILVLSVLIIIHELGHFMAAIKSGVRVEKFAIGFGPKILEIKGIRTDFLICAFPLGGYVKLAGENRDESKGKVDEFFSKPAGVKMGIVFAGPASNYLLAFLLFWIISFIGFPYQDTLVGKVLENKPAAAAGVLENDRILAVNGKAVNHWQEMSGYIYDSKDSVKLLIERKGEKITLEVPLSAHNISDEFGKKKKVSIIGIVSSGNVKIVRYGFFISFFKGLEELWHFTVFTVKGLIFMIMGYVPIKEIAGPLGIYQITSDAAKMGFRMVLYLMAILNINLTVINLLPVPILDGGHIFLFFLEKIRKKPLSEKMENIISRIGFTLLGVLMVFLFYNDIIRIASKMKEKKAQAASSTAEPAGTPAAQPTAEPTAQPK